jgi:hypothetical protein
LNFVNVVKWVATFVTLLGALATTLKFDPLNIVLLNAGAVLFFLWGVLIKDKAMMTVNFGLLAIYVFGLWLRF